MKCDDTIPALPPNPLMAMNSAIVRAEWAAAYIVAVCAPVMAHDVK